MGSRCFFSTFGRTDGGMGGGGGGERACDTPISCVPGVCFKLRARKRARPRPRLAISPSPAFLVLSSSLSLCFALLLALLGPPLLPFARGRFLNPSRHGSCLRVLQDALALDELPLVYRHFSRSHVAASDVRPTSLDTFTEEEEMLRDSGTFSSADSRPIPAH